MMENIYCLSSAAIQTDFWRRGIPNVLSATWTGLPCHAPKDTAIRSRRKAMKWAGRGKTQEERLKKLKKKTGGRARARRPEEKPKKPVTVKVDTDGIQDRF